MKHKNRNLLEETLHKLSFSDRLSDRWKKTIEGKIHMIDYEEGETVVRKGRTAGAFYIVASGSMALTAQEAGKELKQYAQGDFFGAYGLLTASIRQYSVIAREPASAFIMGKEDFLTMLKENPGLKDMIEIEAEEIRGLTEEREEEKEEQSDTSREKSILSKFKSLLKKRK
jgi:CRP-like cAMP-binding protein